MYVCTVTNRFDHVCIQLFKTKLLKLLIKLLKTPKVKTKTVNVLGFLNRFFIGCTLFYRLG